MKKLLTIGISSCLFGEKVRYDGKHKHTPWLIHSLEEWARFLPVCPESEAGLGIPRPPVTLKKKEDSLVMVEEKTRKDHTSSMEAFIEKRIPELEKECPDGFIVKESSPSCGLFQTPVYRGQVLERKGKGIFTKKMTENFPYLPVESEERLWHPETRQAFIDRIFVMRGFRGLFQKPFFMKSLVRFHTLHKFLILAYHREDYREMGRYVAELKVMRLDDVLREYGNLLLHAFSEPASRQGHVNALEHASGFLKNLIPKEEKSLLHEAVRDYAKGLVPLFVPKTLIRHYAALYQEKYLLEQVYINPDPGWLVLSDRF